MKTFKAVRFQIVSDGNRISEFELYDGVIINKESSGTGWLLEIVISDTHYDIMQKYYESQTILDIRVVITRPSNDPALFDATIKTFLYLQEKCQLFSSVIFIHIDKYTQKLY